MNIAILKLWSRIKQNANGCGLSILMSELNQTPSEESTLLSRGYRLTRKLGEGSYAKVFIAEYKSENRENNSEKNSSTLACKVIDSSESPEDFVRKFLPRELDILGKLNHPHLVHVHSIFQRRSKYFIFMRYAENGDLLEFIQKNGAVAENQARIWFRQLALGLQYLHEMEIAHRDLKCENVLLTANYNVKLTDFGFARYMIDQRGKRVLSDTYCGSLSYAAPEILRCSPYNPKMSDIWSIGIILYIILNKSMPFDDANIKRLYDQQISRKWKFREKVVAKLSDNVKTLVSCLLEPEVSKRWRLEQIINSDWISMDPRLLMLTPAEQTALDYAIQERNKMIEKFTKRSNVRVASVEKFTKRSNDDRLEDKRKSDKTEEKSLEVTVIKDAARVRFESRAINDRKRTSNSTTNE